LSIKKIIQLLLLGYPHGLGNPYLAWLECQATGRWGFSSQPGYREQATGKLPYLRESQWFPDVFPDVIFRRAQSDGRISENLTVGFDNKHAIWVWGPQKLLINHHVLVKLT
jgi:hypothetical protein